MATASPAQVLDRITDAYDGLSPQVRLAARHVLDQPGRVAVLSMRQLAEEAGVKPNTLVRLARAVGFDGYDDLRGPFRSDVVETGTPFPDKARWLQALAGAEHHGELLADLASANLAIVEQVFEDLDNALSMTFAPYRTEIVEATRLATQRGATVVAVTDSRSAPTALAADHVFVCATETPLYFASVIGVVALLEALLAFLVADSQGEATDAIEQFHQHRRRAGVYVEE